MLPIIIRFVGCLADPKLRKNTLNYLEAIFFWFTLPYNGWRLIENNNDENIENQHWFMKV